MERSNIISSTKIRFGERRVDPGSGVAGHGIPGGEDSLIFPRLLAIRPKSNEKGFVERKASQPGFDKTINRGFLVSLDKRVGPQIRHRGGLCYADTESELNGQ